MDNTANILQTNKLAHLTKAAPPQVLHAIEQASTKSGVSFSYLIQQANAESSFNARAKAKTSSATGLYQFIDSTWLQMVERYGENYGLETKGKNREQILALRNDPKAASFMAAAFASENEKSLNENWGGDVGATELYFAHFLGAGGAASFLKAKDKNPLQPAADLFPAAARANHNVFYDAKTGKAKTLAQIYTHFDQKFSINDAAPVRLTASETKHDPVPREQPHSLIMARSTKMREDSMKNAYGNIAGSTFINMNTTSEKPELFGARKTVRPNANNLPFYSLIAKPADLMLLSQTENRDKSEKSG